MYVTLTDIQNGEPTNLARSISVPAGERKFAVRELTYYHQWRNISAALKNNQVSTYTSGGLVPDVWDKTTTIPDGYYNVCELSEDVFQPLAAELNLHTPTGRLQLSGLGLLVSSIFLAIVIGDRPDNFVDVLPGLKLKWPQKRRKSILEFMSSFRRYLWCSSRF